MQRAGTPLREGGFTLIELLAVLALIAILAGFTVPSMVISREDSRKETLGIVNAALEEARNRSLLQRKRQELLFFHDGVMLASGEEKVHFPEGVMLVECTFADDDSDAEAFPAVLPFHFRGNTMPARLRFENVRTAEDLVLRISPFGFTADIEE